MRYYYSLLSLLLITFFPSVQAQDTPACPCCTEAHQAFHFWVGDWEAVDSTGKKLGENKIVLMEDKCVMQENWTSASGKYTGTSYNYYDASTEMWYQVWVDNQGGSLRLFGGMVDGNMVLKSDPLPNPQGEGTYINRITWTPNEDGTVRQHWETTTDEGKSWNTAFDGLYRKKG